MKYKRMFLIFFAVVAVIFGSSCYEAETYGVEEKALTVRYVVTLNLNGGILADGDTEISFLRGETVSLPIPVRDGYVFAGWFDNVEFAGTKYEAVNSDFADSERALWAKWDSVPDSDDVGDDDGDDIGDEHVITVYRITYILNDGCFLESNYKKSYETGEKVVLPQPFKDGYEFAGWFEDEDFSGEQITEICEDSSGDKIFYAKWEKIEVDVPAEQGAKFMLILFLNGGKFEDGTTAPTEYVSGAVTKLPVPVLRGYEFKGWYDNESFDGQPISEIPATCQGDLILYAKWEEAET